MVILQSKEMVHVSLSTTPTHPAMNKDDVVQGDRWRIGIITQSLLRLEWQADGRFEDHATQSVVNRDWGHSLNSNSGSAMTG